MGFRENLITDWKDKTIEYQDKKFYILDQFDYENKEYLCGCDISTINTESLGMVFLYKVKDDIFEHVEDNEMFEKLALYTAGRIAAEKLKEINQKYNSSNQ